MISRKHIEALAECVTLHTLASEEAFELAFEALKLLGTGQWICVPLEPTINDLAQFIRKINGDNTMGAGVLAEEIVRWISARPGAEET